MPQFKNKISKAIYYKKREKEIKKQQKALDKEIEKEYREKYPKDHSNISNKLAKKMANFFDILWPDDEEEIDKEYESILSDKEKEELKTMAKEEKRLKIIAASIMVLTLISGIAIFYSYVYFNRSHYEKVTAPIIKSYFKEHYNADIDTDNNCFICYDEKNDKGETEEKCTNLLITTTNTRKHVLTIDDKYIGDDVNQNSFKTSYIADFENTFSNMGIIYDDAQLSYKDYYHDYNSYLDYINILPINMKYEEMVKTNKITVVGKVLYQGEENINDIRSYLSSFSDDSAIYLIKLNQGLPYKLVIVKKNEVFQANFNNNLKITNDITYYELDRNINGTSSVELRDVSTHGIGESYSNRRYDANAIEYEYKNGQYFEFEYERAYYNEPQKPHYYLLKYSNGKFIPNFVLFDGGGSNYTEQDKEDYPLFITITLGSETYIIGDESFGIALKTEKKQGFLCNLGLC